MTCGKQYVLLWFADKSLFGDSLSEEHVAQIYQLIEFLGRPESKSNIANISLI